MGSSIQERYSQGAVDRMVEGFRAGLAKEQAEPPIFYKRCPSCGGLCHMDRVLDLSECPHLDSPASQKEVVR